METTKLLPWLKGVLPAKVEQPSIIELSPLVGDAGFRRYFRLNTRPSLMAVIAPPEQEDNPAFVTKALALQTQAVRAPRVYAVDYVQGFMLLEDFGDDLYSLHLNDQSVMRLYDNAERTLLAIQSVEPDPSIFPLYDDKLLRTEMALFPEWFCQCLLDLSLTEKDHAVLENVFQLLSESAQAQPQVVVHRDYHCRNLLVLPKEQVGVIDFQDGVIGAITYDLVSLLKDCYVRWPRELVTQRALNYARQLQVAGLLKDGDEDQFCQWFDWMGLQRHIKVLGIFARLYLRDQKQRYLDDLPLVLRYTIEVVREYPQLSEFNLWFEERILPRLPQQAWYRDWQKAGDVSI